MAKNALGKGIDALFGDSGDNGDIRNIDESSVTTLPLKEILAADDQPRKMFTQESLQELADSIKQKGILQPVLVRPYKGEYQIVAGERRFRAAGLAGLEEIPVIISEISDNEKLEIALIENIQREDLTPIEEAEAYKHMIETLSISQEDVAEKVGKKRSTITNSLRLLKLSDDMQKAINDGEITAGHARALLSVLNPADQRILFSRICTQGLSVRDTERQASALNSGSRKTAEKEKKTAVKTKDFDIKNMEQKFIDALGTKVQVKGDLKHGKIEISYFSRDDLDRVYDLIVG